MIKIDYFTKEQIETFKKLYSLLENKIKELNCNEEQKENFNKVFLKIFKMFENLEYNENNIKITIENILTPELKQIQK